MRDVARLVWSPNPRLGLGLGSVEGNASGAIGAELARGEFPDVWPSRSSLLLHPQAGRSERPSALQALWAGPAHRTGSLCLSGGGFRCASINSRRRGSGHCGSVRAAKWWRPHSSIEFVQNILATQIGTTCDLQQAPAHAAVEPSRFVRPGGPGNTAGRAAEWRYSKNGTRAPRRPGCRSRTSSRAASGRRCRPPRLSPTTNRCRRGARV